MWSLNLFRIDDAEQMVKFNASRCAILFGALRTLQAPAPSTTMTSAYCLGAGTVGTSALRAVPLLHEHPKRFAVEADGPL